MTRKALFEVKKVHQHLAKHGFQSSRCLGEYVVRTLVSSGGLEGGLQALSGISHPTVSTLTAIISGHTKARRGREALNTYKDMWRENFKPDKHMFISLLRACGSLCDLAEAKCMHAQVVKYSYLSDPVVGTCLVDMYAKCGSIVDAQSVFDGLSQRDVVAWTVMLGACSHLGQAGKALQLYEQMQEEGVSPNDRTCVTVLKACGILAEKEEAVGVAGRSTKVKSLKRGMAIHAYAWTKGYSSDVFLGSTLVSMYGKCGSMLSARSVFDGLLVRNLVAWNAMLAACVEQGQGEMGFDIYQQMREDGTSPDDRTWMSMLQACGLLGEKEEDAVYGQCIKPKSLQKGKALDACARTKKFVYDNFVGSTLICMYEKCGSIEDAKDVFDGLSQPNVVSWTAMLLAYSRQRKAENVLQLYEQMRENGVSPNDWTFVSLFQACGILAEKEEIVVVDGRLCKPSALAKGKAIHAETRKTSSDTDVFVSNSLVSMYGKCGSIMDAQDVFDGMSCHDVVSWTSMVAAYTQQGQEEKALHLYKQMQEEGATPNEVTLVSILQACSNIGCLDICRQIHHTLVSTRTVMSPLLGNTLVHAYGKCSSMIDAESVFNSLTTPDVVSWTALIAGHARQGNWAASLQCYKKMQLAGVKPDGVTFLSLISACSNAGLVERGVGYFESMSKDYGINPELEHYVCIVDLLATAGCFTRVEHLLSEMPVQPNLAMWLCLLGACRKYRKVALGKHAFDCIVRTQAMNAAAYALMLNIYADAGLWDCALVVQELRQKVGAWQNPGQSWIESAEEVHSFLVADSKHFQQEQLYQILREISIELEDHSFLCDLGKESSNGCTKKHRECVILISTCHISNQSIPLQEYCQ